MSPLADDKKELLGESHKFVKDMWSDLKQAVKNFWLSIDMLAKSYSLIITQWMTGDD